MLLHVVTPLETSQTQFWVITAPTELRRQWEQDVLTRLHAYLAALEARLRGTGLDVQTEVLPAPDVAATITARAERDPSITHIAMATHGRGGLARWMLGSVATKVLHATPRPLLLVRTNTGVAAPPTGAGYRTIIVPLDGSPLAEQALEQAKLLAAPSGADLVLVVAVPALHDIALAETGVVPSWMEAENQARRAHVECYLHGLAERLATEGLHVHTRLVPGQPAEALLNIDSASLADLIVMATHGRSGLSGVWLGSIAEKLVRSAETPILLVRPRTSPEMVGEEAARASSTPDALTRRHRQGADRVRTEGGR
jgi:nucleotide-binding universal stress UspA family protein